MPTEEEGGYKKLDLTTLAARRLRMLRKILYHANAPANDREDMYSDQVIANVFEDVRRVCTEVKVVPEKSEREDEEPRVYGEDDDFSIQPGELMLVFDADKLFRNVFFKADEDVVSSCDPDWLFMRIECGTSELDAATAARFFYERFEATTQIQPENPPPGTETEAELLARDRETVSAWFDDLVSYARWLSVTRPIATGARLKSTALCCYLFD